MAYELGEKMTVHEQQSVNNFYPNNLRLTQVRCEKQCSWLVTHTHTKREKHALNYKRNTCPGYKYQRPPVR